jgi:hypothetical protein
MSVRHTQICPKRNELLIDVGYIYTPERVVRPHQRGQA